MILKQGKPCYFCCPTSIQRDQIPSHTDTNETDLHVTRQLIMMFAKGVRTKDYRDVIVELVAQDIVRTEFHSGRFALKNIAAVLATHFRITLDADEELLDKACARVIFEEADRQQIDMIDWITMDALVEARPHLHPIEAARLIDKARAEVERERQEGEGRRKT